MHSDLQDVVKAIKLSQATIRNIKENLFWAFAYNTLGIPIAMGLLHLFGGPLLNPMPAGLVLLSRIGSLRMTPFLASSSLRHFSTLYLHP